MKDFYFSFIRIAAAQVICVFLLAAAIFGVKTFWKKEYKAARNFYKTHILSETSADEVLREETKNGI